MQAADVAELVKEGMCDEARQQLLPTGLDLSKHSCCPEHGPETGQLLYSDEDEPHKADARHPRPASFKCQGPESAHRIDTQPSCSAETAASSVDPHAAPMSKLLLCKLALLAVAMLDERFSHIATIIRVPQTARIYLACKLCSASLNTS